MTFIFGEREEELKAHKLFLMTASPVFHQHFTENRDNDELRIPDIDKETMIEVFRFAYTEKVQLTIKNMLALLKASTKLQMKFLVEKVSSFICKEGINERTVFEILDANQKNQNTIININCFNFIGKNYKNCFETNEFLKMTPDNLRLMLQACKLPQAAAKQAVALWSFSNKDEDLEEFIELISLNEDEPETPNDLVSDSESLRSVNSHARSECPPKSYGPRENFNKGPSNVLHNSTQSLDAQHQKAFRNQHQQPFMQKQSQRREQNNAVNKEFFGSNQNSNDSRQKVFSNQKSFNQKQNINRDQELGAIHRDMIQRQQQHKQISTAKNIFFAGPIIRKKDQFANLDLNVCTKTIAIHSLHFVYDLRTTDKFFKIRIADVNSRPRDLFYDQVQTNEQKEKFFIYTLPRPCQLPTESKIWISIEFNRPEYRPSFTEFNIASTSDPDCFEIRRAKSSHAQIISTIVFADC